MRPGDDLTATIKDALHHSEYLIYLASQEAAESVWVQDELRIWCEHLKKVEKLIIVYIDDEIVFNLDTKTIRWEQTNALPRLLQHHIASIHCISICVGPQRMRSLICITSDSKP